jgi:hypothetical protein
MALHRRQRLSLMAEQAEELGVEISRHGLFRTGVW